MPPLQPSRAAPIDLVYRDLRRSFNRLPMAPLVEGYAIATELDRQPFRLVGSSSSPRPIRSSENPPHHPVPKPYIDGL